MSNSVTCQRSPVDAKPKKSNLVAQGAVEVLFEATEDGPAEAVVASEFGGSVLSSLERQRRTGIAGTGSAGCWSGSTQTTRKATSATRDTCAFIPPLSHNTRALEQPEKRDLKSLSRSRVQFPRGQFAFHVINPAIMIVSILYAYYYACWPEVKLQ